MLSIQQMFIKYNFTARTIKPQYIVIHDTGNTSKGANALQHFKYFNGGTRGASADFFVDDSNIIQIIDYNKNYSWAVGDGKGKYGITNANSVSIEICINSDGNYPKAVENAIDLAATLALRLGLPLSKVVRHYDASRKLCPGSMINSKWNAWNMFLLSVNKRMQPQITQSEPMLTLDVVVDLLKKKGIFDKTDPELFRKNAKTGQICSGVDVRQVIFNWASGQAGKPLDPISATNLLVSWKIITTPSYWLLNAKENMFCSGEYVNTLLVNMYKFFKSRG